MVTPNLFTLHLKLSFENKDYIPLSCLSLRTTVLKNKTLVIILTHAPLKNNVYVFNNSICFYL